MTLVRNIALIGLCLLLAVPAHAAKYAGEAFSLGVGARGLALGGAVVAGPFDGTTAYWNPAGMNSLGGRYITAMHAETFGSLLNHDFISYVDSRRKEHSPLHAFGFYVYYLGGGGIKITQLNEFERPYVVREESHGDWLFSAAVSGRIKATVDFGLTAKIIYRDIGTESGYGLTMDAGIVYRAHRFVNLGLTVTDITTGFIRYSGKTEVLDADGNVVEREANTESIYPTVKPGLMLEYNYADFTGRILTSGDIRFENLKWNAQYWTGAISLDTHWGWELGYRDMVFGRAGFDIGRFTAGGGVDFHNITLDFAYLHHDELDETFRVSAGYRF
ncbi:MAG: hypothetical protein KKA42_01420 [candidate division Zixibacteria bacterium]|nr:hypothetical protein [candidate division Zixibacteria bacterium]